MAVAPTYPGVYIEEIPSGVHTITGVGPRSPRSSATRPAARSTSAVHIFSFADFERAFGGPHDRQPAEPLRPPLLPERRHRGLRRAGRGGRAAASVDLRDADANVRPRRRPPPAKAPGATTSRSMSTTRRANPSSLFNLTVTEMVDQNGELAPRAHETFRNLSWTASDPSYAVDVINAGSALDPARTLGGVPSPPRHERRSGVLTLADDVATGGDAPSTWLHAQRPGRSRSRSPTPRASARRDAARPIAHGHRRPDQRSRGRRQRL